MMASRLASALLVGLIFSLPLTAAELVGVVSRVDLDKKQVLLEGRGAARGTMLTLVLVDATEVIFGRESGKPADLVVGKRVRVVYDMRDQERIARLIHVNGLRPRTVPAPVPAETGAITGILRRVALTDREVVVIGPGAQGKETETTIAVPESARIMKGGKAVTLDELKEDESVSIVAEKRDGRLTATAVQVGPGGPPEKSNVVPKIRLALRIADLILQKMEKPAPQP